MPDLSRDLRRALASTIETAREAAEVGAGEALRRLGVFDIRRPARLDDARNETRKRLRAHAKSLGDRLDIPDGEPLARLTEAAAYVQWHRLLFARFLLERGLLRDETGVALAPSDCREEAAMEGTGDEWSVASTHAARMLPGVFPADDPVEALVLAPEHAKALRDHLLMLDAAIFQADDSLGWTYQFWRTAEKKAINESGRKIGAAELPAVTQLFTEPYMVRFLLHNTLGAWWAGKVLAGRPDLARDAATEDALRAACAFPDYSWDFLRFVKDDDAWRPAAGVFSGWPVTAAALTVLDPCCGSGHFLTEALAALAALRASEDALPPADAVVAVLRDNLAGLEIDGRCVQIAAFALALAAWRIGGADVVLPIPQVAWVGGPPPLPKADFAALANGDGELRRGLEALHDLFIQAPTLGSLIEPVGGDLIDPRRVARIEDSIAALVERMRDAEPERAEGAIAARGMADAVAILLGKWVLLATNVPFLTEIKFAAPLDDYVSRRFPISRQNLATAFMQRMLALACVGGAVSLVAPQIWLYARRYSDIRRLVTEDYEGRAFLRLGPNAFHHPDSNGESISLNIIEANRPDEGSKYFALDASTIATPDSKAKCLANEGVKLITSLDLRRGGRNPLGVEQVIAEASLSSVATALVGITTGDSFRFIRQFWEPQFLGTDWEPLQSSDGSGRDFGGRTDVVFWQNESGELARLAYSLRHLNHIVQNWRRGKPNWKKRGVSVSQMAPYAATVYDGDIYDSNCCAITPHNDEDLPVLWNFLSSDEFRDKLQKLVGNNRKAEVGDILAIELDIDEWRSISASGQSGCLPEPYSDDPTQWLFHGHPRYATAGTELHVALARLSGYRWPAETNPDMRLSTEARARNAEAAALPPPDADGLLALVPVLGERPLADRLRAFCVTAWGDGWTPNIEAALVAAACERANDKAPRQLTLDAWLRTHAARQHAKLFHDRPFLWWITDERADGFTAVAHCHRLTTGNLERLAYAVLGDWITRLGDDPRAEAARVLQAKLARILEGEAPHDIFIRWKPLAAQPLGWDPDMNDGVRLNIRPFIEAGVLAHVPNGIHYRTDRGKDVPSAPWHHLFNAERRNDHHTTLAEKQAARAEQAAKRSVPA